MENGSRVPASSCRQGRRHRGRDGQIEARRAVVKDRDVLGAENGTFRAIDRCVAPTHRDIARIRGRDRIRGRILVHERHDPSLGGWGTGFRCWNLRLGRRLRAVADRHGRAGVEFRPLQPESTGVARCFQTRLTRPLRQARAQGHRRSRPGRDIPADQRGLSMVIQSIWMSSVPIVPDGHESSHSCCSTTRLIVFGSVVDDPTYFHTGVAMLST